MGGILGRKIKVIKLKSTTGIKITTSGTKHLSDDGTVTVSNGNFSTTFDAQSTSTLIFKGNNMTSVGHRTRSMLESTREGFYKIFDISGRQVCMVNVTRGSSVGAEIRKFMPKAGLYIAKSLDGSSSFSVNLQP